MPILFAFSPAILLVGESGQILVDMNWAEVASAYFSAFIGTIAFSAATMFFLIRKTTWWEWLIFAFGTFLCFFPDLLTDIAGIAIVLGVWFWQRYDVKRKESMPQIQGVAGS